MRQHPEFGQVLRYGDVRHLSTESANDQDVRGVFAFERSLNGVRVRIVVNRGEAPFEAAELFKVERSIKVAPRTVVAWGIDADGSMSRLAWLGDAPK